MMRSTLFAAALFSALLLVNPVCADDIMILGAGSADSRKTQAAPDGKMREYATLQDALDDGAITGGDTVYFGAGSHGGLTLRGLDFDSPVTLTSAPGDRAHFDFILVGKSRNITVKGVNVWPTNGQDAMGAVLRTLTNTDAITAEDLDIRSVEAASDYPGWTEDEWLANKHNGILLQGTNSVVRNSRVTGAFNGIAVQGPRNLIEGNVVDGFSGDALRAIGENSTVRGNSAANCVKVSEAHNDGIQSWSSEDKKLFHGTLRGITLEGNRIAEWTNPNVSPLRCGLQGIFIAGYLQDLKIRNNLIMVTAWHGIAVYGGTNVEITHNTVVHPDGLTDRKPWIRIEPGRDGRISENILIANNIATAVKSGKGGIQGLKTANNMTPTNMKGEFSSLMTGDMELSQRARSIDAGSAEFTTTETDILGAPRIKGRAPDAGAFESW